MSRKIKIEEKNNNHTVRNEILQVADMVARDKGIDREEILSAMEHAILKTAQLRYGTEKHIVAEIDRKTGDISIKRAINVVEEVHDPIKEISIEDARKMNPDIELGEVLYEVLPPIEFGRVAAQSARQVIVQKVKSAERNKQFEAFKGRVGEIITGIVKRVEFSDVILDVGRTEGILKKQDVIPNEIFKVGDRIKVLLVSISSEVSGPMLQLSRTHPDFLRKLFEQEVPDIYDNVVKIMSIARDPGSKAKMAVTTSDPNLDPVGACVGVKGMRVQAVVDELKGEKIDIVLWSDNPAIFVVNALSPAEVSRIVLDEDKKSVEAVVKSEQLSSAIGRRGQNVRLASKLTGWNINVITDEQDSKRRAEESSRIISSFIGELDVDDIVAHLLMNEGYTDVKDIAETSLSELCSIDGFDEEVAKELQERAILSLNKKKNNLKKLCDEMGVSKELMEYPAITDDLLEVLIKSDIKNLDDIGDLSTDELLDISKGLLTKEDAEALIMEIRKNWF